LPYLLTPTRVLRQIDEVWYALDLAPMPRSPEARGMLRDALLHLPLSRLAKQPELIHEQLGVNDVYVCAKRRLGKSELKHLSKLRRKRQDLHR
jgi:hypothetical protein